MHWWTQRTKPQSLLIPEADEYISTILRSNCTRSGDIAHITTLLDLPASPYIPVGSFKGFHYRLLPNSRVLDEDKAPLTHASKDEEGELLPPTFLGVSFNVMPSNTGTQRSRKNNMSEESNASANSDDAHTSGFAFFQLGHMQYFPGNIQSKSDLVSNKWKDTGFAVGIQLGRAGTPEDVWVFFNFHPQDEEDGERSLYQDDNGGYLPGHNSKPFACARIASGINSLKQGISFTLTEIHDTACEIVRVVRRADGNPLRHTVQRDE
jgi:hypothetical protein